MIILILFCLVGCVREVGENWVVILIPVEVTTTTTTIVDVYVPQMKLYEYPPPGHGSTLNWPEPIIDWESLEIIPECKYGCIRLY